MAIFLSFLFSIILVNNKISEILKYSFNITTRFLNFFNTKIFNTRENDDLSITNRFNTVGILNYNLLVIVKLILNFISYYLIAYFMNLELNIAYIFLISSINQLFEIVKITPQNIGLLELVNGIFFVQFLNLPIQDGIIFKLNHRIFEVFSLVLTFIFLKISTYILSFSKKINIHLPNV